MIGAFNRFAKIGYQIPKIIRSSVSESLPAIPTRMIIAVQYTEEGEPRSQSASPEFDPIVNRVMNELGTIIAILRHSRDMATRKYDLVWLKTKGRHSRYFAVFLTDLSHPQDASLGGVRSAPYTLKLKSAMRV